MPQSLSNILIHLVFSTKNRQNWIDDAIRGELYAYLAAIHKSMECPLIKIGGMPDHVHILCRLERTVTVSKLVETIKKHSSKWIKGKGQAYQNFAWQQGYGAFSIGVSNVEALQGYIANQRQHHQKVDFKDELRAIFAKYDVDFDERYIWD